MKLWILIILACVVLFICFTVGFLVGRFARKKDGTVIIEKTEDGQRERIRFVMDLELDEIRDKSLLIFKVEDMIS